MGIKSTWNTIETILNKKGFPLMEVDTVPQGKRCTMRIVEVPGDQMLRGAIGSGQIRLVWGIEIALMYDVGTDKRLERTIGEDAEKVIAAIYGDADMGTKHHFVGAAIERDTVRGMVTNTMRFDVQDQAAL
ncbi:MAG: hypothetical protein PHO67_08390 [Candidatus Omnitrophica bacterium]|nr:hypothetical protein [Candidatus Omnitrophota bacterium]